MPARSQIADPAPLPEVDERLYEQLSQYAALLLRWNRAFNLVRVDTPEALVTRHILDCTAAACLLADGRTLDVGSGAGLPGLVLAILFPGRPVVLLDASLKRTRFLGEVQLALGLENVCVLRGRVEMLSSAAGRASTSLRPVVPCAWFGADDAPFDVITARAFAPVARMVTLCTGLLGPQSRLQLLKAELADDEVADAVSSGLALHEFPYVIPGYAARRSVVEVVVPRR